MTTKKSDNNAENKQAQVDEPAAGQLEVQVLNVVGELNDQDTPQEEAEASSASAASAPPIISEDMAGMILQVPFAVAASFWGDYWKLSDSELELMKPSAALVFSDLFGRYVDEHPEAYMLCFTLLTCIGTRAAVLVSDKRAQANSQGFVAIPEVVDND